MSSDKAIVPFSVDVSASAKLTGNIAEKDIGRLANSLADALSPLTEGLGLVGDSIRAHRISNVIHRAAKVQRLIAESGFAANGAPLKFIAPWAEAVSLEDDGSSLNAMWEKLLANASLAYENRFIGYLDILKSMSSDEANFLSKICQDGTIDVSYELERDWLQHVTGELKEIFAKMPLVRIARTTFGAESITHHIVDPSPLFDHNWRNARLVSEFSYPSYVEDKIDGTIRSTGESYHYRPNFTQNLFCHQNLIRKGLAYRDKATVEVEAFGIVKKCNVWFYQATEIGIDFVKTCNQIDADRIKYRQKS